MTKQYKGILFDAGDTLVKLSRPFPVLMKEVLAEHGLTADEDDLAAATWEVFGEAEAARANLPAEEAHASDEASERYWTGLYLEVGRRARLPGFGQAHARAVYDVILHEQPFDLVAGARELLQWARAKGYRLGLVSNWGTDLPRLLDRLELTPFFDVIVISAQFGMEKPNPRIFRKAVSDLGLSPSEVLYIGDDYYNDGIGAWAAGLTPLLVDNHDRYGAGEFPRVHDLGEVRAYLEQA